MPNTVTMREDRRSSNPVFNGRKLKLGTFQTNLDYGCLMSDIEGRLKISWPNTKALAKLADEMAFEALLPVARWRGFGGTTDFNGICFETTPGRLASRRRPSASWCFPLRMCRPSTQSSRPSRV